MGFASIQPSTDHLPTRELAGANLQSGKVGKSSDTESQLVCAAVDREREREVLSCLSDCFSFVPPSEWIVLSSGIRSFVIGFSVVDKILVLRLPHWRLPLPYFFFSWNTLFMRPATRGS